MRVPQVSGVPWWGQAGLLILGMAGTILMEYIRREMEPDDASSYEDDSQTIESKPVRKTRKRSK